MKNLFLQDTEFSKNVASTVFHGFFTRNGGVSCVNNNFKSLNCGISRVDKKKNVYKNREIVCKKFGKEIKNLILVNQTHSNKVVVINKYSQKKKIIADGMYTKERGILLGILTADCAPIIFSSENFVGILHVGWKGLFSGIIENLILKLTNNGENKKKIVCSVGPRIMENSFEIKDDFIKRIIGIDINNKKFIFRIKQKKFFNYSKCIFEKLRNNGITKIFFMNYDTFTNPNLFFSYRYYMKNNEECGRQITIIGKK